MDWFKLLVAIAEIAMSFGYYPQAWHMYRQRSAQNVSRVAMTIFVFGTTLWTLYGVSLSDWTIVWSFVFGMLGSWLVLALTFIYAK